MSLDPTAGFGSITSPGSTTSPSATSSTTTSPAASPASKPETAGLAAGDTCAYTATDPYDGDREVTRYGVVVGREKADPDDPASGERLVVAWLPPGEALLPADQLRPVS